jgi:hypothetical protein
MRKIMKKIVLLLALFGLAFQATSCKSKKAQDDTEIVENADVEKIEAEDSALVTTDNIANDVGPIDETLQAAFLGETSTTAATDPALTTTDVAVTESAPKDAAAEIAAAPTLDEQNLGTPAPMDATTTAATEPTLESTGGITETPIAESNTDAAMAQGITETPVLSEPPTVTASETSTVTKTASAKPSAGGSLKKISDTVPYQFGEGWVNTVYIARPKEKLKDISQKIYGMDKTKELKKINSFLAARSPKGGDKIYYVSPNRPADSMKTISFYEDTGMIAETYIAKKGDNLKKVSKELLGYSDAYKEVWTTNPVASKTALAEGEALRYWKANTSVAPTTTVADNTASFPTGGGAQVIDSANQLPSQPIAQEMTPPPPPAPTELPPPATELPPPPPADMAPPADQLAQNAPPATTDLPPPPPPPADTISVGETDAAAMTPPPPPPPTEDLAAAPVEPKKKMVTPNMEEEASSEGMNSDTTTMLGGVVVLCSLLAFALIRRNKKKKEIEMASMSETNVGT